MEARQRRFYCLFSGHEIDMPARKPEACKPAIQTMTRASAQAIEPFSCFWPEHRLRRLADKPVVKHVELAGVNGQRRMMRALIRVAQCVASKK